jgi:hypothetical protein
VTCGGPDLQDVEWSADILRGASELVAGDPYDLYLTEPAGSALAHVEVMGARLVEQHRVGAMRVVRLLSAEGGVAHWKIHYQRVPAAR